MSKVYQLITDRVLDALQNGTVPWRKPWGGDGYLARNLDSKKKYRGINAFLLTMHGYDDPWWLTFRQAQKLGGSVKKGEKSTPVVFWKQWERENADTGEIDRLPVLRYYSVFHVSQCEGIDESKIPQLEKPCNDNQPIDVAEKVVKAWISRPEINHNYERAFYRPSQDLIGMPPMKRFEGSEEYYSTLFHELGHSTGHERRLNRKAVMDALEFGSNDYGQEELVAEMTATYLCGHCGIDVTFDNSASYINSWMRTIKGNPKMVVQAAAAAQKAADMILNVKWDAKPAVELSKAA